MSQHFIWKSAATRYESLVYGYYAGTKYERQQWSKKIINMIEENVPAGLIGRMFTYCVDYTDYSIGDFLDVQPSCLARKLREHICDRNDCELDIALILYVLGFTNKIIGQEYQSFFDEAQRCVPDFTTEMKKWREGENNSSSRMLNRIHIDMTDVFNILCDKEDELEDEDELDEEDSTTDEDEEHEEEHGSISFTEFFDL